MASAKRRALPRNSGGAAASVDVADGVARQPHAAAAARDLFAGDRLRHRRAGRDSFAEGQRANGHRHAGEIAARLRPADFLAPADLRRGGAKLAAQARRVSRETAFRRCSISRPPMPRGWCRCAGWMATTLLRQGGDDARRCVAAAAPSRAFCWSPRCSISSGRRSATR